MLGSNCMGLSWDEACVEELFQLLSGSLQVEGKLTSRRPCTGREQWEDGEESNRGTEMLMHHVARIGSSVVWQSLK